MNTTTVVGHTEKCAQGAKKVLTLCIQYSIMDIIKEKDEEWFTMPKTSNINIRINPNIKEQAEKLFSNFGMNISDAINIFLHQSLIYGGLPFNIKMRMPNETTLMAMQEVEDMISEKIPKQTQSIDSLFEELEI